MSTGRARPAPTSLVTTLTMSHVFLYVKSHNFPPNGQISREGASHIPHFFQPWLTLVSGVGTGM